MVTVFFFVCVYTSCSYFINLIYVCTCHNANYISSGLRTFPCLAFSGFKMCNAGRLPFNEYQANTAVCIIWPPQQEMATHSNILAWRIPGTGEPGGLPSMGSHRVGHDWSDLAAAAVTPHVKNLLATQETKQTWVWSLGCEDPLEEKMATHCSILAWNIPWAEKHGRKSKILQRAGQSWAWTWWNVGFRTENRDEGKREKHWEGWWGLERNFVIEK